MQILDPEALGKTQQFVFYQGDADVKPKFENHLYGVVCYWWEDLSVHVLSRFSHV